MMVNSFRSMRPSLSMSFSSCERTVCQFEARSVRKCQSPRQCREGSSVHRRRRRLLAAVAYLLALPFNAPSLEPPLLELGFGDLDRLNGRRRRLCRRLIAAGCPSIIGAPLLLLEHPPLLTPPLVAGASANGAMTGSSAAGAGAAAPACGAAFSSSYPSPSPYPSLSYRPSWGCETTLFTLPLWSFGRRRCWRRRCWRRRRGWRRCGGVG